MTHYNYMPEKVCARVISFDLDDDKVKNISFMSGCNGNLKALSKILDGWSVNKIEEYLKGNECGKRGTSCADQLAIAVRKAYDGELEVAEDDD